MEMVERASLLMSTGNEFILHFDCRIAAMYRAKDVMTREILTLSPKLTVEEAIRQLLEHSYSGAPVVSDDGMLVGIVSEFQLLEVIYDPETTKLPVEAVMTRSVLSVDEGALLSDVANLFIMHRIRRVPVLRDGQLVGLITRRDVLRYIIESRPQVDEFLSGVKAFGH
jgi:CBS domain-containing protein